MQPPPQLFALEMLPGAWSASAALPLPGAPGWLAEIQAACEPEARVEVQLLRRRVGADPLWTLLHTGPLQQDTWCARMDGPWRGGPFTTQDGDALLLRARLLDGAPCRLQGHIAMRKAPPRPGWRREPVDDRRIALAIAGQRRLLARWDAAKARLDRRCFFAGEQLTFDVEVVRLHGAPFADAGDAVARLALGAEVWEAPIARLDVANGDVLRGHVAFARVPSLGDAGACRVAALSLVVGGRVLACGHLLLADMPRPHALVIQIGGAPAPDRVVLADPSSGWTPGVAFGFAEDGTVDGIEVEHLPANTDAAAWQLLADDAHRVLKPDATVHLPAQAEGVGRMRDMVRLLRRSGFVAGPVSGDATHSRMDRLRPAPPQTGVRAEGIKPQRHYAVGTTRIRDPRRGLAPENLRDVRQFELLPNASFHHPSGQYASFCADPFLLQRGGRFHLFFEARTRTATIAVASSADGLRWEPPEVVLAPGTHRSFPFVFEMDGDAWMIPESAADQNVVLHRAADFPRVWEPVRTLLEGKPYCDSFVLRHAGLWYLFTWTRMELHVHVTDDLVRGALRPHPMNPVCRGVRFSRPAGRPFTHGGALYRTAQDCERFYGTSVHLLRIDTLTPDHYAETLVHENLIGGDLRALTWKAKVHHYDVLQLGEDDWLCAFDGTGIL